ncbi:MAG: RNA polymerase sigma factor [Isosphaeraceae bacterium]
MPGASSRDVLRQLNTLFHCGTTGQVSDAELLGRFAAGRGEAAEAAFAALVERHGKMVLGVCQRVLGNREAAEDAFQATFLVLARKAASIARREQLASWLYGVALRAALDSRGRASRQKAREKRYGAMRPVEIPDPFVSNEVRVVLDEELARLPERSRAAIVLCELEGLSRRQAAAQLGISEGTLSSRLARAKIQLKHRLTRRGLALSAIALGSCLAQDALAVVVPPTLVESTIQLATLVSTGTSLAGIVSTPVATLTQGVLKAMLFAKVKSVFLGIATLALITTGMGVLAQTGPGTRPAPDDDRLKAVEQKLDKLLEVLGRSNRPGPTPAAMPPTSSAAAPAEAPVANTPPVPVTPPLDTVPPLAVISRAPTPRGSTPNPSPPEAAPDPRFATSPSRRIGRGRTFPRSIPDQPQSLAERLQSVEHRLDDFERRLGALERRLQQVPGSASVSGLSPARAGSSADLAPPVSRHAIPGARSADTLDAISTIPPGPASADSARARAPSSDPFSANRREN